MTTGYRSFRDSDENYWLFRFPQAQSDFEYVWGPVHRAGFERRIRDQFPDHFKEIVSAMRTVTIYNFWLPSTPPPPVPDEPQVRLRASGSRPKLNQF